ncbi:MAG TPA: amidohydrolase family protein, partial [Candidatus Kapabacteria bacterium]|nr:amidohydrolase family protein [Candidatus Kapabacteria bacterium]
MSAEEALVASTLNSAYAIEQSQKLGSLEIGKEASFIILDSPSYKDLFYHYGVNHIEKVFIKGKEFNQ